MQRFALSSLRRSSAAAAAAQSSTLAACAAAAVAVPRHSTTARAYSTTATRSIVRSAILRAAPPTGVLGLSCTPAAHCVSRSRLLNAAASPLLHSSVRHKSCGIVGLPNVGKSTLFNALTDTQAAQASNYPFCTIEPNTAQVAVPDARLRKLAELAGTSTIIEHQVKFTDIAGIIRGASEGAGLGNQFLQNIRDVDVILHVVRCFDDADIIHVDSRVDPIADMGVIETELLLADLQSVEKRIENLEKGKNKKDSNPNPLVDRGAFLRKLRSALNQGVMLVDLSLSEEEAAELRSMQLLTSKPMAYICNVDEAGVAQHNSHSTRVFEHVAALNSQPTQELSDGVVVKRVPRACLRVCSQLESEVQALGESGSDARKEFLASLALEEGSSLRAVIHTANTLLDSIAYYTVGEKEARAWAIARGTNAQAAAGKIHSDLAKGFVCAEVIKPEDYIRLGGDAAVRQAGLMRTEGKSYVVQDGDIMLFRVSGQKGR